MQGSLFGSTSVIKKKKWSGLGDRIFSNLTLFFAFLVVGILIALVIVLNIRAIPAFKEFGWGFIGGTTWNPVTGVFGALPAIYGTLLSSIIGLIIAIPISIGASIFLIELSPNWLRAPVSFVIEMLAAIPSVIIGLWGIFVMVPFIKAPVETWLGSTLNVIPLFQGPPFGQGFLAAGVILAIMIIPIITAMSRDVIRAVPKSQREAMLALGATRWETIRRAVLPYSRSGLIGASILGLGRALGETMAVTMVIGNGYKITASLFSPGATISSWIANQFPEAAGGVWVGSLIELALILFAITLLVNIVARLMIWKLTSVKTTR